ncbi:hypothetical protein [Streptomyces sp. NPDC089799]|uniref:hypothetical protein n=1 Tax=Streptomyces sp. NPDC089799 TaxID=3155066 RepID=UPI00341F8D19
MTPFERGSAYPAQPEMSGSDVEEPAPAPVFVDQSGLRGRLLRGFAWPVSVVGAILAIAMGSSLIGVQADAPVMGVPAQPSWSPAPPPPPVPSPSPTRSSASAAPSPLRTARQSATPRAKTAASTAKTAVVPPKNGASATKTPAGPAKRTATPSKPTGAAPRGAKPSGQTAKQP